MTTTETSVGEVPIAEVLELVDHLEVALENAYRGIAVPPLVPRGISRTCRWLASQCARHRQELEAFIEWYSDGSESGSLLPRQPLVTRPVNEHDLIRHLIDLHLTAAECMAAWGIAVEAGTSARDQELVAVAGQRAAELTAQVHWLRDQLREFTSVRGRRLATSTGG